MRAVWLTDPHLNFLTFERATEFLRSVDALEPDHVLVSGDIAEAHDLLDFLEVFERELKCPVSFVLGNHDYYHGAIGEVRAAVKAFCSERPRFRYLSQCDEPIELTSTTALIGHDGWADGRLGDYERSLVEMNDSRLIADLAGHNKLARWQVLQQLGDEAAAHLRRVLPVALEKYQAIIVLTHVPPFREACWHEGQHSNDEWAPHFTCKAVGDVLLDFAHLYPHCEFSVFCGHTHSAGKCRPARNLRVFTGKAQYGAPEVQSVLEL